MNPLPFLGLALVASGYAVATDGIGSRVAALPDSATTPAIMAYDAGDDLSVYDMLSHGAQVYDRPHCDSHQAMADRLAEEFAETAVSQDTTSGGLVMELWASAPMGTWTVLHRGADGISCVVSSGTGWTDATDAASVFRAALDAPGDGVTISS